MKNANDDFISTAWCLALIVYILGELATVLQ